MITGGRDEDVTLKLPPAPPPYAETTSWYVPGGAAAYRDCIRVHTTLDLEAESIHATGLAEIERIDGEFVELGRRVLGTTDLPSTLAASIGAARPGRSRPHDVSTRGARTPPP